MRLDAFNKGEHVAALSEQARVEAISKILYPSDETAAGQELRLRQEYFFVSASLQDLVHRHLCTDGDIHCLPDLAAVQLNDTHPSIAIPELMRLLIDLHGLPWDEAWGISVKTLSYTNHTLLPEALESWPLPLLERVLPRHLEIIYRINEQHLRRAREKNPDGHDILAAVSLIDEHGSRRVRMSDWLAGRVTLSGVEEALVDLGPKSAIYSTLAVNPNRFFGSDPGSQRLPSSLSLLLCHPNAEAASLVVIDELNSGLFERRLDPDHCRNIASHCLAALLDAPNRGRPDPGGLR